MTTRWPMVALLGSAAALCAVEANATPSWQLVYSEPNQGNALLSVTAVDATHAWTVGVSQQMGSSSPVGLRTTDGITWMPIMLPTGSGGPLSLTIFTELGFADENQGWLTGVRIVIPNEQAVLWRTDNGGMSWTEAFIAAAPLEQLQVLPTGELYGAGGSTLVRSTDGTQVAETAVPVPGGTELRGVFMLNSECGYLVASSPADAGGGQSAVLWSGDGGDGWEERTTISALRLRRLWFVSADLGWAAGTNDADQGVIARTGDGGRNWSEVLLPDHPPVFGQETVPVTACQDVRFFDDQRGVALCLACTGNCDSTEEDPSFVTVFARSHDGGQSWEMDPDYEPQMTAPPFGDLMKFSGMFDMAFPSPNAGYLVGQNNLVLRYDADQPEADGWGPPSCESGGTGGFGGGGVNPPGGGSGPGAAEDDSGCGCRQAGRPVRRAGWLGALLLAAMGFARRRSRYRVARDAVGGVG